jgi:BirA family biotin operon repressor/biotin-[acetyl-CoA-carboxylase] ligase
LNSTRVIRRESTQSTNADAMDFARQGEEAPLWVVACEQLAGRGRHGRPWRSPPGNLYASLLLIDPCPADVSPQLSFVASVALAEAVETLLGGHGLVQLKWPNDLLCDGAKLSGILLEAARRSNGALACVIGIGVNCRSHPPDLSYRATHLSEVAGRDVSPDDLLPLLDVAMMRWLGCWKRGGDFAAVRDAWLARAAGRGKPVEVVLHDRTAHGVFETVDDAGRLVVATNSGPLIVEAGDVRFAPDVLRTAASVA